jgi:hypothetical protein
MTTRRVLSFLAIAAVQFVLFEAGLRTWGSSEAAPAFQGLFEPDAAIGYRLKAHARTTFTTKEFSAEIATNALGLRDNEDVGPKAADERRVVLLGDSLVLAVQVPFEQTFGELLEQRLNARSTGPRYRVLNAGVQGYGPVEEQLFFKSIAATLQPDLVLPVVFVGNDAEEAFGSQSKLDTSRNAPQAAADSLLTRLRRLVRRSMVLQILRLRVVSATSRFTPTIAPPEPPLQSYAAQPAPRIAEGFAAAARSIDDIRRTAQSVGAATAIVLMPARFQVDEADYGRLHAIVAGTGGALVRDAASERFAQALAPLGLPRVDVLPALRAALPGPDLFYQETVHLTPRGHAVVADALDRFIAEQRLLPR